MTNSRKKVWRHALCALAALSLLIPRGGQAATDPYSGPGGLSALPVITGFTNTLTADTQAVVVIQWSGYAAPYTLQKSAFQGTSSWTTVVSDLNTHSATVPADDAHAFFRVAGKSPNYAGSDTCFICHDVWDEWSQTKHAQAFSVLQAVHVDKNPACVVCHTVAMGQPTGFSFDTNSPNYTAFLNVQCENCHGPSGNHAASTALGETPVRSISAAVCGGCHTGPHHPNFDEWSVSPPCHRGPGRRQFPPDRGRRPPTRLRPLPLGRGPPGLAGRDGDGQHQPAFGHGRGHDPDHVCGLPRSPRRG